MAFSYTPHQGAEDPSQRPITAAPTSLIHTGFLQFLLVLSCCHFSWDTDGLLWKASGSQAGHIFQTINIKEDWSSCSSKQQWEHFPLQGLALGEAKLPRSQHSCSIIMSPFLRWDLNTKEAASWLKKTNMKQRHVFQRQMTKTKFLS